eukprot:TRINITY_DN93492_c0_g1_i1.p1 TRINITY_DN93492_c0_g1~~TRINITY_DN93492_c0_g1_i1.p1  ORF type:complete len:790 (+),score=135.24 TRINITY_DN93492_c0_g1_i1:90-2372(+)
MALETLPEHMRDPIFALVQLPIFSSLPTSLVSAEPDWAALRCKSVRPHDEKLPGGWDARLSPLQRLCLFSVLRKDAVPHLAAKLVREVLNLENDLPRTSLQERLLFAPPHIPVLLLPTARGPDPKKELSYLAKRAGASLPSYQIISLAGARENLQSFATNRVEDTMKKGGWVVLCDCDLCPAFLGELSRLLQGFDKDALHESFRCFLINSPQASLPDAVVLNCLKLTWAAPSGIRSQLLAAQMEGYGKAFGSEGMQEEDQKRNWLDQRPGSNPTKLRLRLDVGLSLAYAIIAERRRLFGTRVGFSEAGDELFMEEGLHLARMQMNYMYNELDTIKRDVLENAIRVHFGGGISEYFERRLLFMALGLSCYGDALPEGDSKPLQILKKFLRQCGDAKTPEEIVNETLKLPRHLEPEAFGLHPSLEIKSFSEEGERLLSSLSSLQEQSLEEEDLSLTSSWLASLQHFMPSPIDEFELSERFPSYEELPNGALAREVASLNRLLRKITSDLETLMLHVEGLCEPYEEIEMMCEAIYNKKVPQEWFKLSPSASPLSGYPWERWRDDLKERAEFFSSWVTVEVPNAIWLGAFASPKGYLTCLMQDFARRNGISPASVAMQHNILSATEWSEAVPDVTDGCYVRALTLEGAHWDLSWKSLKPGTGLQIYSSLPLVHFQPVKSRTRENPYQQQSGVQGFFDPPREKRQQLDSYSAQNLMTMYTAPIYQVPTRGSSSLIGSMELPSKGNKTNEVWALAGVAVLINRPID